MPRFPGVVAEWIARVYASGKGYDVVVWGLGSVDIDRLDQAEEAARTLILARLRASYPPQRRLWEDPQALAVYEFRVEVNLAGPDEASRDRLLSGAGAYHGAPRIG